MRLTTVCRVICVLLLAMALSTGRPNQSAAFTIGEERELGEKLLYQVRGSFRLFDDPDVNQYVNGLGREILEVAGPQYFHYHFFVIEDKSFNAFAAPSGLIFLHSGLIETMKSENELMSVMAHEVGHVVSRHIASRMEKGKKVSVATMAMILASIAVGDPSLSAGLLTGSMAAGESMNLSFSRADEEQADRLAYDWMRAMGRDPGAMAGMLQIMRRISRYRSAQVPQYLLTHPDPEARLDYVRALIDVDAGKEKRVFTRADDFDFLRVKYRILTQVKEARVLREYFAGILATAEAKGLEATMAKYGLAMLSMTELDFERAIAGLEEVRARLPERSILKVDLGMMYMELGQVDLALALFEEARQDNGDDMYAAFQLGRALLAKGKADRAESLFQRVAAEMPDYAKIYYELGRLESGRGHSGDSYYFLGRFNMLEGKDELAERYLRMALDEGGARPENVEKAKELLDQVERMEMGSKGK